MNVILHLDNQLFAYSGCNIKFILRATLFWPVIKLSMELPSHFSRGVNSYANFKQNNLVFHQTYLWLMVKALSNPILISPDTTTLQGDENPTMHYFGFPKHYGIQVGIQVSVHVCMPNLHCWSDFNVPYWWWHQQSLGSSLSSDWPVPSLLLVSKCFLIGCRLVNIYGVLQFRPIKLLLIVLCFSEIIPHQFSQAVFLKQHNEE